MLPYVIFIIVMFLILCKVKKDKFNIYDVLALIVMILFSGLRYGIGKDYSLYEYMYLNMSTAVSRTGLGYYLFSIFMHRIFPTTAVPFFFLISALTCLGIYYFCKKKSINPAMSVFLFIVLGFYTTSFNTFRQMLSMAFMLVGYACWDNKKVRSVICFIISILLHQVAIFGIVIIIFSKLYKKPIKGLILFVGGIILILAYKFLIGFIVSHISSMALYQDSTTYSPGIGTYLNLIVYLFFFILININRKKLVELNPKNAEYMNIFSISYMFMMLGVKNTLFVRLASFGYIFIILLLPELYYNVYKFNNKKIEKILTYTFLIMYFFLFIISFGGVVPYSPILF